MILWIVAAVMTAVFLLLLIMVWLRKINFDAIHQNFLEMEDVYGGKVIRNGFAVRPRFAGEFKGKEFSISITSDKSDGKRVYYIALAMQARSKINFSVLDHRSLADVEIPEERRERMLAFGDDRYMLEVGKKYHITKVDLNDLTSAIRKIDPFVYILVGKTNILLERASNDIFQDTKLAVIEPILDGMYELSHAAN